ncbi:MAG: hypothetical protein JW983_07385, partial [Elusimicrobia bacterium]|nr:hypothetical protein [Elusimicrobiota bacterium]
EGLYLDQASFSHPFPKMFRDKIVFDDPEKLLSMIYKIIKGKENPVRDIPENVLKSYDMYNDNLGVERFRQILTG